MSGQNGKTIFRRVIFATFLILEIYVGWRNFRDITASEAAASEPVAEWERRMEPLKAILPSTADSVGYVSDSPVTGIDYYNPDDQIEYTLTQYVMAPVVVRKGADHEWVIGNFSKQGLQTWKQANPGAADITSVNYGIYLIHMQQK